MLMHRSLLRAGPSHGLLRRAGGGSGHPVLIARRLAAPGTCRTVLQLSAAIRPAAPTAEPPEASITASIAPVTVTLADGTTVTLIEPTPRQLLRYQRAHPATVSWKGLLGVLALSATALVAAAATCFMLCIRPLLKALSVTLAEMEQAAKDMQQAAHHVASTSQLLRSQLPTTSAAVQGAAAEVQELAGSINKAANLLTPDRLLKQTTTTNTSSRGSGSGSGSTVAELRSSSNRAEDGTSSSGNGSGGICCEAVQGKSGPGSLPDGTSDSGFGPQLQTLQNLAAVCGGISDLCSSVDDGDTRACSSGGDDSSSRPVWDASAVTASAATASKGSLERLHSDLRAAVNAISTMLTPQHDAELPGPSAAAAADTASKHEEQQQQQQVLEASALRAVPAAPTAGECDQENAAALPPPAAAPAAAAATSLEALDPATVVDDDIQSPLSSVDRRIRIAAGIRRSGSAAVLKSLSEEDIEHALAAAAASSSSSSSSSNLANGNSSSSGRQSNDHWGSAGSSQGAEITQAPTAAAAAAAGSEGSAARTAVPAVEAAAAARCSKAPCSSRASSPSGRRRRKTKKIEEDEWGLPTVMNMSSDICNTSDDERRSSSSSSSSSAGRRSLVQQAADTPAAVGAAAAMSSSSVGADGARATAPADLPTSSAAAAAAKSSSSSSSYMAPSGWVDLPSDCSDDEDYAGYKETNDCYDSFDEGIIQQMGSERHNGGSSSSSGVFAGYDACQDVHLTARPDDGITWSQLHQDPQLMRRVFCDNQEQILQTGMNGNSSGQQPLLQKPEAPRWHQ